MLGCSHVPLLGGLEEGEGVCEILLRHKTENKIYTVWGFSFFYTGEENTDKNFTKTTKGEEQMESELFVTTRER